MIPEIKIMTQQKVWKKIQTVFSVQLVKNHGTKIRYTSQFVLMSCPRSFLLMFCGT